MIKALKHFDNLSNFLSFTKQLEDLDWKIGKLLLKERVELYSKLELFIELKESYIDKGLSFFELKDEEVITWLDTLLLLRRCLIKLINEGNYKDNVSVIMEYPFVFGNFMRADYIITYEQTVIILEFGMFNQDEKRKEERYTKKIQENIGHRNILANLLSDKIKIYTYVFMYRPEYDDKLRVFIRENQKYNLQMITQFVSFLDMKIQIDDKSKANYQLQYLEIYR